MNSSLLPVLLAFGLLFCLGCNDDSTFVLEEPPVYPLPNDPFTGFDPDFTVTSDTCDLQIGGTRLLPTSFQVVVHEEGDELIYVNEQGQEALFTVTEWTLDPVELSRQIAVDSEDGMSIESIYACYGGEILRFRLESEVHPNKITCLLWAFPNYIFPEQPPVDLQVIFNRVDNDNSNIILYKSTDRAGSPFHPVSYSVLPQLTLNDRTFQHVETTTNAVDYPAWYTQRLGVIGFTDAEGNIWRLK